MRNNRHQHPRDDNNSANEQPVAFDIDGHADNANWLRILEERRIKRGGKPQLAPQSLPTPPPQPSKDESPRSR
jgi:hypothetical protein